MAFFENTRKPTGFGGRLMVTMMNIGHRALADWGLRFLPLAENADVLTVVRRRRESASDAEKVPDGKSVRYRLFSRQRREVAKAQPNRRKRWPLRSAAGKRAGIAV